MNRHAARLADLFERHQYLTKQQLLELLSLGCDRTLARAFADCEDTTGCRFKFDRCRKAYCYEKGPETPYLAACGLGDEVGVQALAWGAIDRQRAMNLLVAPPRRQLEILPAFVTKVLGHMAIVGTYPGARKLMIVRTHRAMAVKTGPSFDAVWEDVFEWVTAEFQKHRQAGTLEIAIVA